MDIEPLVLAVAILVAVTGGAALGFVARGFWAAQAVKAAQEKAGRIIAEARAQQKELILQA
jgi:Flp pilus assembly protein CpaB